MKTTDIYPLFLVICVANLFGLLTYALLFKDSIMITNTSSSGKLAVDEQGTRTSSNNSNSSPLSSIPSELVNLINEVNEKLNIHINEINETWTKINVQQRNNPELIDLIK